MGMHRRRSHRSVVIAVLVPVLLVLAAPVRASAGGPFLVGVTYGNQGWAMDQVRALEAWQGKRHAVVNIFTNWDGSTKTMNNLFGQQLPNVWANGNVPLVTWEPFTGRNTPSDIERRIAGGAYDAYVQNWALRLRGFLDGPDGRPSTADDRRAYLRLGHEMNGDWYPWGAAVGANHPSDFVAMWRRVHGAFDTLGIGPAQLQWIWTVNHEDVGGFPAEAFFPGDTFLDWVAVDGYNWGASQSWSSWRSPSEVLGPMVGRVRQLSARPLAFTETASTTATPAGASPAAKSQWVTGLFDYAVAAQARMVVWFNQDKETEWAVFGGARGDGVFKYGRTSYRTYAAYRDAVNRPEAVGSTGGGRLISDAQFAGTSP
ncbi:MAG: glycoside hydrolase family 26 protein [Acidimicrobiia bacterium]